MNNNLKEVVFILDRSGSMSGLEGDTIGGYNSVLGRHKSDDVNAYVSTVLFNDESEVIHDRVRIQDITPMTPEDYFPSGCTALFDAVGDAIKHIRLVHKYAREEDRPSKTLFVITTDGLENASNRYNASQVKEMVEQQKNEGWEFLFLGANIDAIKEAGQIGISRNRATNYHNDEKGISEVYACLDLCMSEVLFELPIDDDWDKKVKEDFESRW